VPHRFPGFFEASPTNVGALSFAVFAKGGIRGWLHYALEVTNDSNGCRVDVE
jgi:hypothetical protein